MNSQEREFDDLTALEGIGEKRQAFIRNSLGVSTYRDLAALSVDEIAAAFSEGGKLIAHEIIQQWISTASEMAQETEVSAAPAEGDSEAVSAEGDRVGEEGEWEWLDKIFVIEFRIFRRGDQIKKREISVYQTRATKEGNWLDNGTKRSVVMNGAELYPWMVEQLGEQAWPAENEVHLGRESVPTASSRAVAPAAEAATAGAGLTQIKVFQPVDAGEPASVGNLSQPFENAVSSRKPFALELEFAADAQANSEPRTPYVIKVYAISTGTAKPLGEVAFDASTTAPALRLSNIALQPGIYHLQVLLSVRTTPPKIARFEVQSLRVI